MPHSVLVLEHCHSPAQVADPLIDSWLQDATAGLNFMFTFKVGKGDGCGWDSTRHTCVVLFNHKSKSFRETSSAGFCLYLIGHP